MAAAITLKRYIRKCEEILLQKNIAEAETLQNEIISVFSDIDNIRGGLSNYSPVFANETMGEEYKVGDDGIMLRFFTPDNGIEVYEDFCSTYFPHHLR